jgi:DNA-directed RNA polymerase specialized sigma24 family protein
MTSRERLEAYRRLHLKIERKREHALRLRAKAENLSGGARYDIAFVTESFDGTTQITYLPRTTEAQEPSRRHDPLGDTCAALANAERELDALLKERRREYFAVRRIIAGLPVSDRKIMRLRYLRGWPWPRIAKLTGFSVQYLKNRHRDVLNIL